MQAVLAGFLTKEGQPRNYTAIDCPATPRRLLKEDYTLRMRGLRANTAVLTNRSLGVYAAVVLEKLRNLARGAH